MVLAIIKTILVCRECILDQIIYTGIKNINIHIEDTTLIHMIRTTESILDRFSPKNDYGIYYNERTQQPW